MAKPEGRKATWIAVLASLVAAFVLGGCGEDDQTAGPTDTGTETTTTTDASEPRPDPSNLVVELSDLPTGYSLDRDESGPRSLAEAVEDATPEQAEVIRRERVAGHEVTFESPNLRVIACNAAVYRSSDGAEEVFRLAVEAAPKQAKAEGTTFEPASIDETIGDETQAFTVESQGASAFAVLWRYENLNGACVGGGLAATDPAETVRVAQAQQQRFEDALR